MAGNVNQFEITIIGAGLVGLTTAISFAKKGFNIALCNNRPIKAFKSNNALDVRSIALSLSTKQIYNALGIWPLINTQCKAIDDIQVSAQGHWGVTRLNHKKLDCEALGYVVESHLLETQLINQIEQFKNITLFESSTCEAIEHTHNACRISLKHNASNIELNTQLCFICDGAQSTAKDFAGFTSNSYDYQQSAIATHVTGLNMNQSIAYERFTPEGPLAMLPLTNSRYGLVWTNGIKRNEQLMSASDDEFISELQKHFGFRVGKIASIGQRVCFPIIKKVSKGLVNKRCVVLGNAAHNLHPVAGQSLNLAIRDIAHLSDLFKNLDDVESCLSHYQDIRKKDHLEVINLGDQLITIFSNNLPILNHARSAGLAILDVIPQLKNDFAWRGMGFSQQAASAQRG